MPSPSLNLRSAVTFLPRQKTRVDLGQPSPSTLRLYNYPKLEKSYNIHLANFSLNYAQLANAVIENFRT